MANLVASAWVGGTWAIGFLAAPVLFGNLADKSLAGMLAGRMFEVTSWAGMACALFLLSFQWLKNSNDVWRNQAFWLIMVMLLAIVLGQFCIQPVLADLKQQALPLYVMDSSHAGQFKMWHGISSLIYLAESVCGAWLLLKMHTR